MSPAEQIALIDKQIDANRYAVLARMHFNPTTAGDWQRCWDRCPDLRARKDELYLARGFAQEARDKQAHREWQAQQRRERAAAQAKAVAEIRRVKSVALGKRYEVSVNECDRFIAVADGHCTSQGLVRLLIESPERWRGSWIGVRPEDCRAIPEAA